MQVAESDKEKTAFCAMEGLYEFNIGFCNAPATFQRLMDLLLAGLQWSDCLVYLDDVIIMGRSFEEHLSNLQAVFDPVRPAEEMCFLPTQGQLSRTCDFSTGSVRRPYENCESVIKTFPYHRILRTCNSFLGLQATIDHL